MVTTPSGAPVAMVHCNNCTSDLNAWISLLGEAARALGANADQNTLYQTLFGAALNGDTDLGGLVSFNYVSGEPVTGFEDGRPLFSRLPDAKMTLANFMRAQIYGSLVSLKIGMDILLKNEKVSLEKIYGHGGLFKTPLVGQKALAAACKAPVTVMRTAGEGGAWGMALLAQYLIEKQPGATLEGYLADEVFRDMTGETIAPEADDVKAFDCFTRRFSACMPAEREAIACLRE